jgi:hypothetical protein
MANTPMLSPWLSSSNVVSAVAQCPPSPFVTLSLTSVVAMPAPPPAAVPTWMPPSEYVGGDSVGYGLDCLDSECYEHEFFHFDSACYPVEAFYLDHLKEHDTVNTLGAYTTL